MKRTKKLLALLASLTVGLGCLAFTACGQNNGGGNGEGGEEETNKIVLTADTDFTALVSEKVDGEGWKTAFATSTYTDCTILLREPDEDKQLKNSAYIFVDNADGNKLSAFRFEEDETADWAPYYYYEKTSENVYQYLNLDPDIGRPADKFFKLDLTELMAEDEEYAAQIEDVAMTYRYICPDFGDFYSKFVYDENSGSYVFNGSVSDIIKTNMGLEYYHNVDYVKAEVKIVNGKLAYINYTVLDNQPEEVLFYDFGSTTVTLPEVSEVTHLETTD